MKRTVKILIALPFVLILSFIIYVCAILVFEFTVRKYVATKGVELYITEIQGTTIDNIKSMTVSKDFKHTRYSFNVIFKDNLEVVYRYYSDPKIKWGEKLINYEYVDCFVLNKEYKDDVNWKDVKYPPMLRYPEEFN